MAKQTSSSSRNWSTPLTIGTFLFTGVSGFLLFFHLGEGLVKEAHEWVGIAFVLGALLHVKVNWAPFKRYFSRGLPRAVMAAVLAGSLAFMVATGHEEGGNPMISAVKTIEAAPLSLVAQLQSRDAEELHSMLEAEGLQVNDTSASIATIARNNGKSERELIALLFAGPHS
ncbi:MAG: DUF4405 domain-containing protein [Candidatus Thiodiazotropha sp.]|jgi:hypothetical protein